ncbi:MAG: hypothetical protein NTU62_10890, partial [Spirochaetes bacterium]|nr:hypothetical protein [Spirochaetota bacterium]
LPVTEAASGRILWIPWFKRPRFDLIEEYVEAYRKVSAGYRELLPGDAGNPPEVGGWHFFKQR